MSDAFEPFYETIDQLREVGAYFHLRGWSLGTSSNYSVVLDRDPLRLLLTASGKDKSRLTRDDFVLVGGEGQVLATRGGKPSAEALLHVAAAASGQVGAVLHTHSVWATLLSDIFYRNGGLPIEGYEMLKGLAGIQTHEHRVWIEIFENTQDIAALSRSVLKRMADPVHPLRHGYLIRKHGLYTWGRDLDEARRHIEILEFLFEAVGRGLPYIGTS